MESKTNAKLKAQLDKVNLDAIAKKVASKSNAKLWNWDVAIKDFAPDCKDHAKAMKICRRKLRNMQARFALAYLSAIKLGSKDQAKHGDALMQFSKKYLVDPAVHFTNVSPEQNPDQYALLHTAYAYLFTGAQPK